MKIVRGDKNMSKDVDFDELYQYIKLEILEYHDKKIPKYLILRLIGLKDGKFMANNKVESEGSYNYKIILLTFKLMKGTILNAIQNTEIKDERHKINLIFKIIESQINDVKDRIEAKKKGEEKLLETDLSHQTHEQQQYTKKSNKNDKLKELW
jgi:predicted CDP-diglyceride synthetase/phosphatidate cytidylyltransferase